MSKEKTEAANYYSKDFEWEQLRHEIETDPTFLYHLLPFIDDDDSKNVENSATAEKSSVTDSSNSSPLEDSDAWDKFHSRHSTGKFFKVQVLILCFLGCSGSCVNLHSEIVETGILSLLINLNHSCKIYFFWIILFICVHMHSEIVETSILSTNWVGFCPFWVI